MYSRKSRGYIPYSPPPNYNGVAFNRDFRPGTVLSENGEKEGEAPQAHTAPDELSVLREDGPSFVSVSTEEELPEDLTDDVYEDGTYLQSESASDPANDSYTVSADGGDSEEDCENGENADSQSKLASTIASKEFTLEDLLIIGSVLLFVSGELDGDLMLLLGLLLIAGL